MGKGFSKLKVHRKLGKGSNKKQGDAIPPDWSGLPPELAAEIGNRLLEMENISAFRGVCKAWRAAVPEDTFKGSSKIPFLMLAEEDGGSDERRIYSLYRKVVWRTVSLPWFRNKRCVGVGFGWVLTVAAKGGEVNLVKAFTGATIELPSFNTIPERITWRPELIYVCWGMLSADPSRTSDFFLMSLTPPLCTRGLVFWRPGWKYWKPADIRSFVKNIGMYKGRMLDIDDRRRVRMWDPPTAVFVEPEVIATVDGLRGRPYIVESSSGELLIIVRHKVERGFQTRFTVIRIDVVKGTQERVKGGIGKDAIFLGENGAVCYDAADFPGVLKPNCLY